MIFFEDKLVLSKIFIVFVFSFSCITAFSNPHVTGCPDAECLRILQLGEDYLNEGKANEALPLLKKAFEKGSFFAANELGIMYQEGLGVKKNLEKAKYYYEVAANHGDEVAIYNLGEAYFIGDLYPQNFQKAKRYLKRVNNLCASNLLGVMYIQGLGGAVDENKAKDHFNKAVTYGMMHFLSKNKGRYGFGYLFTNYAEIYTSEILKKYSPATKNAVFLSEFTRDYDDYLIQTCLNHNRFTFKEKFIPNKIMDEVEL